MPTNIASRSVSSRRTSSRFTEILQSDELTLLLFWTATGLAIALALAAFGLQPVLTQDWIMTG